jgi:putative peptide zinc metalloprotease protein
VTVVETRLSVWEVLAGRAPGQPVAPADPGLWAAVAERLNPARARPRLRPGIEEAALTSVRGVDYAMLRSPDGTDACYLRLTPQELALARLMDGTRTVARLVAEFARIAGRLAPDQVTRVVADLAGNRMLEELPIDAFRPLDRMRRRPWPVRVGRGALAFARGRRLVVAPIDPMITFLYRAGGRLLFTRVAAVLLGLVALAGLGLFGWTWFLGSQPVFLTHGSYAVGAAVLLGLNVLALACHELGHALATKHAGRRVPAAGFLVYFGIPSVFVDTTDVWMAGRRARLLTTASGPATGLVLAGACQIVGLLDPALAPWCFKLSFAWYVNVAFNLNPFLALDGYYLLMDWIEVPNLRARGLAWVIARLRRRPPAFGTLDREGRLVALYGMLSLVWLVIAANIGYRIYVDRVSGLVLGLWHAGWWQRVLVAAVVVGLAAPVVWGTVGWLGKRWRRLRDRLSERRVAADLPRRYDALRGSALGRMPAAALTHLARDARWVRPRTGEQLVFAGGAQPSVFVVVDGALEGRRPGDPAGTVRERVGAGGVVGLANALTGAASVLAWHTAGTTLLSVPVHTVAATVGPLAGPPPADRAELESLFDHSAGLSGLSTEDRLGLMSRARLVALPPGAPLTLPTAGDAAVVAAGQLVTPDGTELGSGFLIGPAGELFTGAVAHARSHVRVWMLPALGGLPLLLGSSAHAGPAGASGGSGGGSGDAGRAPSFGAHPRAAYPPLAAPPGPPPSTSDDVDRRFERKLWWLLILLLLLALLLTGANFVAGPAWSEMPEDHALLRAAHGTTVARIDGVNRVLNQGDEAYVSSTDVIRVGDRSDARLTFRGGGYTVLCGGSRLTVGPLSSLGRPIAPAGSLAMDSGKLLAYTTGNSAAFLPLALRVTSYGAVAENSGAARYSVGWDGVDDSAGQVTRNGTPLSPTGDVLGCGDGRTVPVPGGSPSVSPSASESPSASPSPSLSPSASPSVSPTPRRSPTTRPTTQSPTPSPTNSPSPPPDKTPPVIHDATAAVVDLYPSNCGMPSVIISSNITDPDNSPGTIIASFAYSGRINGTVSMTYNIKTGRFEGSLGGFSTLLDSTLSTVVSAKDVAGNQAAPLKGPVIATHSKCPVIG